VRAVDHAELLRRLTINDARVDDGRGLSPEVLSPSSLALVRLAALVAVGGRSPSYGAEVDAALAAGVSAAEVVDVLCAVAPVVGLPNVVTAAPRIALALGLEPLEGWDEDAASDVGTATTKPPG